MPFLRGHGDDRHEKLHAEHEAKTGADEGERPWDIRCYAFLAQITTIVIFVQFVIGPEMVPLCPSCNSAHVFGINRLMCLMMAHFATKHMIFRNPINVYIGVCVYKL